MKDNADTGANGFVEKFRAYRRTRPETFLEKLVESLMLKRRQLTLHQNLSTWLTRVHGCYSSRNSA
ncbi:hypothetical protein E6H35_10530 [Candidatus Bathyarchaeota archaeon]|nr:MAG: hypothetical protein E6H35_10530 [Candidatus Bathyarchaeota archaeon]